MKKMCLIALPVMLAASAGTIGVFASGKISPKMVNAETSEIQGLNELKSSVSRTFDFDVLPTGTETGAVLHHQNYNNVDHRKQNLASSSNIFIANTAYTLTNTVLNTTSQFAGAGCYERTSTGAANGLAVRANTDRSYLDDAATDEFAINFFVKDYKNTNYYGGLFSFRGYRTTKDASLLYNVDVGTAGFWINPINSSDASDNTYRKFLNSTTTAYAGRTTYNGFDNNSFGTASTTGDAMKEGQWYMVTYNFSSSSGITIYRDGVKKVNYAPTCKLATNSGDTDGYTVTTLVDKLRAILKSKNAVMMVMRGQSTARPIGTCVDELTIFNKNLSEQEMTLWKDSYKAVTYIDGETAVKTYRDMNKNLIPVYELEDKGTSTFYKWATDTKLLTQMGNEIPSTDIDVYADWKDANYVSDGAKILAQDIADLDTCSNIESVNEWVNKIALLDESDTNYVNNKTIVAPDSSIYTVGDKIAYMLSMNQRSSGATAINFMMNENDAPLLGVLAISTFATIAICVALKLSKRFGK